MADVTITVRANGPYKVVGPVRIVDPEGVEFVIPEGSGVVLCRCGHSRSKPFCDKSHRRVGFVAEDTAPRAETEAEPDNATAPVEKGGLSRERGSPWPPPLPS